MAKQSMGSIAAKAFAICLAVIFTLAALKVIALFFGVSLAIVDNRSDHPQEASINAYSGYETIWRNTVPPHAKKLSILFIHGSGGIYVTCSSGRHSGEDYIDTFTDWIIRADVSDCPKGSPRLTARTLHFVL